MLLLPVYCNNANKPVMCHSSNMSIIMFLLLTLVKPNTMSDKPFDSTVQITHVELAADL